jgi:hypothetical protein
MGPKRVHVLMLNEMFEDGGTLCWGIQIENKICANEGHSSLRLRRTRYDLFGPVPEAAEAKN